MLNPHDHVLCKYNEDRHKLDYDILMTEAFC